MTRDELVARTRQLIAEGERLGAAPVLGSLQIWLQHSDDLLRTAWGHMDRYHLSWLSVGRPRRSVRGRSMTDTEEAAYVREVAAAKSAVLRASLDAAERQGMPFVGETRGVGSPRLRPNAALTQTSALGAAPAATTAPVATTAPAATTAATTAPVAGPTGSISELDEARRLADAHRDPAAPRAPRPERMQR